MPKGMKNMRTLLLMIFAALSLSVSAQTITLNGNVKDTTGEPIIGASIVEKGNTTNGTITDLDGNFSLKVPANATVVISYIGMKTQEIYNPQIEMFARFKMKSSFHKTKRII